MANSVLWRGISKNLACSGTSYVKEWQKFHKTAPWASILGCDEANEVSFLWSLTTKETSLSFWIYFVYGQIPGEPEPDDKNSEGGVGSLQRVLLTCDYALVELLWWSKQNKSDSHQWYFSRPWWTFLGSSPRKHSMVFKLFSPRQSWTKLKG